MPAQRRAEPGAERARQPAQALDDIGPVGPEAHDLAESLVERAIGAIAKAAILDHHRLGFGHPAQRLAIGSLDDFHRLAPPIALAKRNLPRRRTFVYRHGLSRFLRNRWRQHFQGKCESRALTAIHVQPTARRKTW